MLDAHGSIIYTYSNPPRRPGFGLHWRAFFVKVLTMVKRVALFVDYQNAYRRARDAFHSHITDPHWMGQINPSALGAYIVGNSDDPERVLNQVRIYRGMPNNEQDPKGYGSARRQIAAWRRNNSVSVTTRPLRYPRDYPASPPQEKGIDVQLALDFVMMAVRNEYDVGVLMSNDTDLRPALEEVISLGRQTVEVASWAPLEGRTRFWLRLAGRPAGSQPYCHWIDYASYLSVQDTADYTRPR